VTTVLGDAKDFARIELGQDDEIHELGEVAGCQEEDVVPDGFEERVVHLVFDGLDIKVRTPSPECPAGAESNRLFFCHGAAGITLQQLLMVVNT